MSDENLQVVRAVYDAFRQGDEQAMLELIDPSVVFTPLPDTPDVRSYQGHEDLLQALDEHATGAWDDFTIELRHMRDLDDRVLASFRWWGRGKISGIRTENDIYGLFSLRAGKVVRWQFFPSEQQALDAAGSG
jgi:ketosteroid isomerase-like protein